jgi:bacterioferritin-associated ferredoxin
LDLRELAASGRADWNTFKNGVFPLPGGIRCSIDSFRNNQLSGPGSAASMIVCSCNVLSDRDVRTAVSGSEPPRTAGQVYGCLGCSPQCGRCARTIRRIMDEAVAAAGACPHRSSGE